MKVTPKYVIVANRLRQKILEKEYEINDQLPQETAIAKSLNVSRITVRKALDILVNEGLIYRIQGSGTFVKDNQQGKDISKKQSLEIFDFNKYQVKLINFGVSKPGKTVMNQMKINQFDLTYEVERLIMDREKIIALQNIFMPVKVIQGIQMKSLMGSIYDFVEDELDLVVDSAIRTISSEMSNDETSRLLDLPQPEPLLTVGQRSFLDNGQIFEYTYTYIRSSQFSLHEAI
ncbi:GntR family transcriptional regulator [Companilactobacillus halodurans]|uniref:GntR family transcriptional regulator n=1 Tax=Companilactobacillus halodurans TaxID=2584183 RepID=A0A5P0ZN79_9LACO|nr:GntR family transcriptional regulator [Companilactobacillus halodurans]MQS75674.1 GntR family transcriptional regulator [Companilactobacillus halodurans]MQS97678.1 GntR family transcriptional regulator [Companilactobacillus halodurans]